MILIPAIDLINGQCVRLTQGDYDQKTTYSENPLEVAKQFEAAGIERLHLVDLDGAKAGKVTNLKVLESIASQTKLTIDFGGGIHSIQDVGDVFNAGAAMATIGSLAVKQPQLLEEWVLEFGAARFLIGADVLNRQVRIKGWLEDGGIDVFAFIGSMLSVGICDVFCTDISKDGMLQGPSIELYQHILSEHPEVNLIASGGVQNLQDLEQLQAIGCTGAIVGKALYEGSIQVSDWLNRK